MDREGEWERVGITRRETARASLEEERDRGARGRERGNYSGDIDPAATRQPLSLDSLDSLDSAPTHLHAYTRFTSSPSSPPPPPSPRSPRPFPLPLPRVALHHPGELLFDLLPLFLFFVFLSCSWSFPSLPPLLPSPCAARFIRVHSSIAEPESTNTRETERCSLLRRRKISDAMQFYNLVAVPQWTPLSLSFPLPPTAEFTICACLCTCWWTSVS